MPFDPLQGPLVLAASNINYPNARLLRGTAGALNVVDGGAGSTISIAPLGNLLGLSNLNASGLVSYSPSAKQFFGNKLVSSDGSVSITNPGGGAGGINLSVVDGTSSQNVTVESGAQSATTPTINLSSANSNMTIAVTQDSVNNKSDVVFTVTGGGGGSGLTSVGLSEVSGGTNFNFTNNPLTANGTIVLDIAVGGLPLSRIAQNGATTGQILSWSGSAWAPASATSSTIAVIAPGLSSTAVGGITFSGSGVTGSAAGGVATINIPGGGGGGGLTSVGLTSTGGTATITGSPLTANGAMNIEIPNWSGITASSNVQMNSKLIEYCGALGFDELSIQESTSAPYVLQVLTSVGTGNVYDSLLHPIGGTGTAGQVLSLVSNASGGTSQVLQWVNGGGGSGAVSSVTASGGTNVINPTTGNVVLQMDLPLFFHDTTENFFIGNDNSSIGDGNFFVNGVGAPDYGVAQTTKNTSFGYQALALIGGAANNSAFGYEALYNVTTGGNNTGVGTNALYNVTTGSHNTALGYSAGPNDNIITSRCTFLGSSSESTVTGISNSAAIGYNAVVNSSNTTVVGDPTVSMELTIGSNQSIGFENETGNYSVLSLRNAENSCLYMDQSTGLSSSQYVNIPSTGLIIQLASKNLTFVDSTGFLSRLVTYANDNDAYPTLYAPPANSLLIGNANTTGSTQVSEGRDFLVLPPPTSGSSLPTSPLGVLGYSVAEGTTWFSNAPALAASFLAFGGVGVNPPVNPVQHVSYIATVDPDAPGNPTFFSLPSNFAEGSSFRVIGSNPYGWQISTNLPLVVAQKIIYGNLVVTSTSGTIAAIQTDPNATYPSPTGYATDWAELTYIATEEDGTQVWSVMSPCNLDLFQA